MFLALLLILSFIHTFLHQTHGGPFYELSQITAMWELMPFF